MNFPAYVKNVNANVGKSEISFSFVMKLDDENMERAKELAFYIGKSEVVLNVTTRQMSMSLFGANQRVSESAEEQSEPEDEGE